MPGINPDYRFPMSPKTREKLKALADAHEISSAAYMRMRINQDYQKLMKTERQINSKQLNFTESKGETNG